MSDEPVTLPPLPTRLPDAHKGTCGRVAVVGGSDFAGVRMIGAPALTALAALRSGAGLVQLVMPEPLLSAGLTLCASATGLALPVASREASQPGDVEPHEAAATMDRVIDTADVLAIGPGFGVSAGSQAAVLRAIQQERVPIVVDADGLNCLALIAEFKQDFHAAAVLTPHPGEFKRICAALGLASALGIDRSRTSACQQLAQRIGCIVVLKGQGTIVSDGVRTWTCTRGHPCLATAGTGDVLTGVVAAFIGQFCPTVQNMFFRSKLPSMPIDAQRPLGLFQAACLAVLAHATAGEQWSVRRSASTGLLSEELTLELPSVMEALRHSPSH